MPEGFPWRERALAAHKLIVSRFRSVGYRLSPLAFGEFAAISLRRCVDHFAAICFRRCVDHFAAVLLPGRERLAVESRGRSWLFCRA
jgi:hypothetical protein